ncbi:hypothetical protein K1720_00745 [Thermococcus argininiproducens]|uniref:Probable phosphoenolpyruvate synthase n=1 Tax=Thermococcus argininiproducens TaxID=2866384 RepID=A0A9E7MAI0_9EURY|nr:PEP/pyruvate-binding domain-containing protein [Thermococcus argininiproducens]USH00049.1 hypothetical protein K1720_00745 [Thermococcus argininiproducens]
MSTSGKYKQNILWFEDISKDDLSIVGGKGANLGELVSIGIRVPEGFVVTSTAFKNFMYESNIWDKIQRLLRETKSITKPSEIKETAEKIQEMIVSTELDKDLEREIIEAYEKLCEIKKEKNTKVAIRSSATAEDLPSASFAGMQDTYLYVSTPESVIKHVKKCWASLYTPRAIVYRNQMNIPHENVYMAVVVQAMVRSKAAGVMFTVNPITGNENEIVIEGSWGLGEAVVSGRVIPDHFVVDKNTKRIIKKQIAEKTIRIDWDPYTQTVKELPVFPQFKKMPSINEKEIALLVEYAKKIEDHYGVFMDIEWAIDRYENFPEKVKIVQARAETVWNVKKGKIQKAESTEM